jgi:hypothetical protein
MKPDRIGDEVRRELSRFGPASGMAEIVRVWPTVVGEQIARNAWPARLARDRTLHVATSSSAWAFELAQLEPRLLRDLAAALDEGAPSGLRFAPGKLPEPSSEESGKPSDKRSEPSLEDQELAAALASGIADENLRKIVAKAAAASLARRS